MPTSHQRHLRAPLGLLLRIGIAVSAVMVNLIVTDDPTVLAWAGLIVLVDLASSYLLDGPVAVLRSSHVAEWAAVCVSGLGAAAAVTAGPGALLLLLIPASMAGERLRPLGASLLTAVQCVLALLIASRSSLLLTPEVVTFHQTLALVTILAFLVAWGVASRTSRTGRDQIRAAEAASMLERLTDLAQGFDHGFDGPAHADDALSEFVQQMGGEHGVALVADPEGQPQTWAMIGPNRQPWPEIDEPDSPLARAWAGEDVVVPRWRDPRGRERALAAAPLRARDGRPIGVLVVDRPAHRPFDEVEVFRGFEAARRHETFVELARLFAWLRDQALDEERDRLSRQMHDGIGQEIAALGYQLDAVRMMLRSQDPALEALLADVRESLSVVASDVRLHISDLRRRSPSMPRAHVAIGTRLAAFRSATGIATHSTLDHTPAGLDEGAELAMYRVVAAVLRDASSCGASWVSVRMRARADAVTLVASHDGSSQLTAEALVQLTVMRPDADVSVPENSTDGVVVRVVFLVGEGSTGELRDSPAESLDATDLPAPQAFSTSSVREARP